MSEEDQTLIIKAQLAERADRYDGNSLVLVNH